MSVLTSTMLNTLELLEAGTYWVHRDTYYALNATAEEQPRLVDMAGRHPAYVGKTPQSKSLSLIVLLLASEVTQRMADYAALVSAAQVDGLVSLKWTENSVTRRYWCHVQSVEPSAFMTRAIVSLVAPNPVAETL